MNSLEHFTSTIIACCAGILFLAVPALCSASSLTLDPGRVLCILQKSDQKDYKGEYVTFSVHNGGKSAVTYDVSVSPASDAASAGVTQGYKSLPDVGMVEILTRKIDVASGQEGTIRLLIKPVGKEESCNQHWEASVSVTGLPSAGSMVRMAAVARLFIETPPCYGNKAGPDCPVSLAPSLVSLGATEGKKRPVIVYNNSDRTLNFRVAVVVPPPAIEGQFIPRTEGWEALPDRAWCTVEPRQFELLAGSEQKLDLSITIPEGRIVPDKGWEALLLVQGAGTHVIFARIQIGGTSMSGPEKTTSESSASDVKGAATQ